MSKLLSFKNKSAYPDALLKEAVVLATKLVSLPAKSSYYVTIKRGWGSEHSGYAKKGWRLREHSVYVHADCPSFVDTLVHEFCHVKDFCDGKKFSQYNRNWKNRPHEKRAMRDTNRLLTGELSSRKQGYRKRLFEIEEELKALYKAKSEASKAKTKKKRESEKEMREELGASWDVPITLVRAWYKNRDKLDSVDYYRCPWDGVRVELWAADGWCFDPETHCDHAYSTKDAIDCIKWLEPCDCEGCKESAS